MVKTLRLQGERGFSSILSNGAPSEVDFAFLKISDECGKKWDVSLFLINPV
jgi:hypothetical protein